MSSTPVVRRLRGRSIFSMARALQILLLVLPSCAVGSHAGSFGAAGDDGADMNDDAGAAGTRSPSGLAGAGAVSGGASALAGSGGSGSFACGGVASAMGGQRSVAGTGSGGAKGNAGSASMGGAGGSRAISHGGSGSTGGTLNAGSGGSKASSGGRSGGSGGGPAAGGGNAMGSGGLSSASGAGGVASGGVASGGGPAAGGNASALIELALNKPATASSVQPNNVPSKGNDGNVQSKYCPVDGSFPQWWRVDLGTSYVLDSFVVTFEHPDRKYTYELATSQDDASYTVQVSASGVGAVQGQAFPATVAARYVRMTIKNALPGVYNGMTYPTWGCIMEFSVTGR